jgi:uncharacterized membrane protein YfbV (UPF0208 family)
MSVSIGTMVKDGHAYMKTWPMKKELYALFPECRVISATQFAYKVLPGLGIFSFIWVINGNGMAFLPQALAMAGLFFSLPLQGQLWLGHRANQELSPSMQAWHIEIVQKMQAAGVAISVPKEPARYKELANTLKQAFDKLDSSFTERWF